MAMYFKQRQIFRVIWATFTGIRNNIIECQRESYQSLSYKICVRDKSFSILADRESLVF